MIEISFFILVTLISFGFFAWLVFQVKKHKELYDLPPKLSINCRTVIFKKRYILALYLSSLLITTFLGILVFMQKFWN